MSASSAYRREHRSTAGASADRPCQEPSPRGSVKVEPRVAWGAELFPRADVYEDGDVLVVEVELPGRRPRDVRVVAESRVLEIRSPAAEAAGDRVYRRRERGLGPARREIPLPVPVRHDRAEASLRDGLLVVRMPIESQPRGSLRRGVAIVEG